MKSSRISIIIKALNEEGNIARGIESALRAIGPVGGEVLLADSASTDRTIEIAKTYPIRIVQLKNADERRCGVGPQLGFQHSLGDYVYILDGDMEIDADFLPKALAYLERESGVGGVGGYVREMRIANVEFQARVNRQLRSLSDTAKTVDSLGGGGVYRRSALEAVGYMSDRNLHAFEEYDLGARLRSKGWRLVRLPDEAARHFSYDLSSLKMLWRRLLSGSFMSPGEVLRAALSAGYLPKLLLEVRIIQLAIAVWAYWALVFGAVLVTGRPVLALAALLTAVAGAAVMGRRHGSFKVGAMSILSWHISAIGLLLGAFKPRVAPNARIEASVLQ